ncbi:hypothetical protein HDV57DRAFT_490334 [Trichoderma longibrachiatum]|uniref:Uncharacterized protein n=1 Tax=Trichoderma longibrachiatum ATCC 18648 TaxID=983965 RepID=A0A2T4C430_TRILO|nr:hypothetical protein M440DRAFT_1401750 [Trichoderma longibrachiatum ATCC 18648]
MSILAPGDRQALLAENLTGHADKPGFIMLHKRFLNRFSAIEHADLPLSTPSVAPEAYITIPEDLVSLATVKYLGFNDETATQLWNGWAAKFPEGAPIAETEPVNEVSFVDAVIGVVAERKEELDTWAEEHEPWIAPMNEWGIAQELQDVLMDPVFKDMRDSGSLFFWLADTIELRYSALQMIQEASLTRDRELQRADLEGL